jgi:tetratricopeptide (TPR) repeat protein
MSLFALNAFSSTKVDPKPFRESNVGPLLKLQEKVAPEPLTPGSSLKRELSPKSVLRFSVKAAAEEFLLLKAEPGSPALQMKVLAPAGTAVDDVACPGTEKGAEWVAFVTARPGEYVVEISFEKENAKPASVTVELVEQREPTERDRQRVEAQREYWEALRIVEQNSVQTREAISKYELALKLFRSSGARYSEALTLDKMAIGFRIISEHQKALELYQQSLPIWRELGDEAREGNVLTRIGVVNYVTGNLKSAIEYCARGLVLTRKTGDRVEEAWALNIMGVTSVSSGEFEEAIDYYQQAYNISVEQEEKEGQAISLKNLANAYSNLGDMNLALDFQARALKLAQDVGNAREQAVIHLGMGSTYSELGDFRKSLEQYEEALPTIRTIGDRNVEAQLLAYSGRAYMNLGDFAKGKESFERALSLTRTLHDKIGEGTVLGDLGNAFAREGNCQRAVTVFSEAAVILKGVGNASGLASVLGKMAQCQSNLGQLELAKENTEAALDMIETTRTKLSNHDFRTSYFATNSSYHRFYADLLMQFHRRNPSAGFDARALQASEAARARGLVDLLREAKVDLIKDANPALIQQERLLREQMDAKIADRRALFTKGESPDESAAIEKELNNLLGEYRQVQSKLRLSSPHYASLTLPQPLSLNEIQEKVLDADTLLLEYSLGEERSYLWLVSNSDIRTFELPAREKIAPLARRFCALVSSQAGRLKFETEEERRVRMQQVNSEYGKIAGELGKMVLGPVAGLLGKKRLLLVSDGELDLVPFSALSLPGNRNPMRTAGEGEAGPTEQVLITEHELVSIPSASVLSELRRELAGRTPAPLSVAVFADPVFEKNDPRVQSARITKLEETVAVNHDISGQQTSSKANRTRSALDESGMLSERGEIPRLPFTRREADAITSLAPKGTTRRLLDFDANREAVTGDDLGKFKYIHFATHGLLNNSHPEVSGVLLSMVDSDGSGRNGFLTTHDVFNLKLRAELVVISSCKSGLGKNVMGEGMVGLTRGFMYAGAARVLVSLWDVNDQATAELMTKFYKGVFERHLSPAAALREAQLSMAHSTKWKEPFYWAGFVLQGEPK